MTSQRPGTQGTGFSLSQDPSYGFVDVGTQDVLKFSDYPEFSGLSQARSYYYKMFVPDIRIPFCEALGCQFKLFCRTSGILGGPTVTVSPTRSPKLQA